MPKPSSSLTRTELWSLVLLALASVCLYADQNLMGPNLTQIAQDFGLDPVQRDVLLGGRVSLLFWLLGGTCTVGIGWFTDRVSRRHLYTAVLLVGAIPCLLTGFATTYEQFLVLRALTGIGIGGALPLSFSMVSDLFPARHRPAACAALGFSMGLGMGSGQLMAGLVGPEYGWRLPFLIAGAPNLLVAPLFWLTVREPARGATEESLQESLAAGQTYSARIDLRKYKELLRTPTNLLVLAQALAGTVPWGVFFVFLTDFYAQDKGYSVPTATLVVMASGLSGLIGGLAGGFVGSRLYQRNPALLPLLCAVTTTLGVIPTWLLLNFPAQIGVQDPPLLTPILYSLLTGVLITVTGPNIRAALLNANLPEARGSVISLYTLANDVGMGLGPVVVSSLVVLYGRQHALNLATGCWLLAGAILFGVVRTFPKDERAMREKLAHAGQIRGSSPSPRS